MSQKEQRKDVGRKSVPAGGPATINGILYQLLWSLLRASRATIESTSTDASGELSELFLTLEPVGGGGDLVVSYDSEVVVEQLKARPDGGTWSLRELVEGVIPDLYLSYSAVPERSKFRFVTEGRIGQWKKVYNFFQSLGRRTCPEGDPISGLDAVENLPFGGQKRSGNDGAFWNRDSYTEATLFEKIVAEVRKRKVVSDQETESTTQQNLWHLLGIFEFIGGQDALQLQQEIDSHLLAFVDHHERIPQIRDAMLADLARRATEGGARIEAGDFFHQHELNAIPLTDWSHLRANAAKHVDSFLSRRGYDSDLDVRTLRAAKTLQDWPDATPILAVTGESGQGKSWCAYRMAIEARPLPQIVVAVDATGRADSTMDRIVETLWQEVASHDAAIPIYRIADRVRRVVKTYIHPWLILIIDGVQNQREAIELVRESWEEWGVRVLLTCQPQLSERIVQESQGRCMRMLVEDFDVDELHEYLSRCFGDEWPTIPDTVWSPLRRPLLANLYRQTIVEPEWRPESEYELYAAFWKRLLADEALDGTFFIRLVAPLLQGASYPWSGQQVANAGLNPKSLARLTKSGWIYTLRDPTGPHFEIPHDRLLNWAVALSLAEALRENRETVQSLGKKLRDFLNDRKSVGMRYMGFVPMDFLWLVLQDSILVDQAPDILSELEQSRIQTESLYLHLIPTIGASVVPALNVRLKATIKDRILCRTIADAIGLVGGTAAIDAARELLMSDDPLLQRSAIRIFSQCPVSDVLDRLWELHIISQNSPNQFLREHESKHALYNESYGALRECCRVNPTWLDHAIQRSRPEKEPTHTLGYLIAAVGGNEGKQLWQRNKVTLKQKVDHDKQRSIATCIQRFSDTDEIEWLVDNIANDNEMIGPMSLSALSQLSPLRAIEHIEKIDQTMFAMTRKWYANQLFAREPDAMQSKILKLCRDSENPWTIASIYREVEYLLDAETLNYLFGDLETRLEQVLANEEWGTREPLHSELEFLASLSALHQLKEFSRRADSRLEEMLTELLLRIGPRSGLGRDSFIRDSAIEVLYRLGGDGFTTVLNSFLHCESLYGRLDAIELAAKSADSETIRLLSQISQSNVTWDGHYIEQCRAAEQLVEIGEWTPVLRLVERIGLETLSEITDLPRYERRPPVELVGEARDRVVSSQGSSLPGDILVMGMGGQKSDATLVRSILANCHQDSELAHACVIALDLSQDNSDVSVPILANQLKQNEFSATNALIVNGTKAAFESLRDHSRQRFNVAVAINLVNQLGKDDEEVVVEVRDAIETELRKNSVLDFNRELDTLTNRLISPDSLEVLLDSKLIRTHLRESSFASEGSGWFVGTKASAIRCLSRFDIQAAFLAATTALRNPDWHDRDYYPYILMELDMNRAFPVLFEQLAVEKKDSKLFRAICGAMIVEGIDEVLREYLDTSDQMKRKVGCIVAGWTSSSEVIESKLKELLNDFDESVSRESADAIMRIRRRNECRELSKSIMDETDSNRRWLLLDCLLSMADPGDIHRQWPVEGPNIGEVLSPLQINYVTDRLKRVREKLSR